jgi:chloramphenicol-sensitive protein RarD
MIFNVPAITPMVLCAGEWWLVRETAARARHTPLLALGILGSATLIGAQFWVFMLGPVHGHALEVSLGFFLMPLALVLIGRNAFAARLTRPQLLAALTAAVGWQTSRSASVASHG